MRTSNKGLVELAGHEGICLSKYKDSVGVWTIGIGATRTEIPDIAAWPLSKTITMQEAFDLFKRSIVKYENAVNKALTRDIPQYQFDALVSWCYNVGVGYTKTATVIKLVNQGAPGVKLYNALMMFRKPSEIIGRRTKEANLLAYGKYSNDGRALLFPVSKSGYPIYGRGTSINVWEYLETTSETQPEPLDVLPEEEKRLETKPSLLQRGFTLLIDALETLTKKSSP